MSNAPLMPMATAVWLVENTTLTFRQIANFCNLSQLRVDYKLQIFVIYAKLRFRELLTVKLQKVLKLITQLFLVNFLERK